MRVLVVSDIHANREAFEAVLQSAADRWEGLLCLGDTTGYGCDARWCIQTLRTLASDACWAHVLAGNHDAALTGRLPAEWFNREAREALARTERTLDHSDRDWLAGLDGSHTVLDGVLAVHGSPLEPLTGYLRGGYETLYALSYLADNSLSICFAGHTHEAVLFQADPGNAVVIPENGRSLLLDHPPLIVNPGSVGFPRSFAPEGDASLPEISIESFPAYYVLWDTEASQVSFEEARYDRRPTEEKIRRWNTAR